MGQTSEENGGGAETTIDAGVYGGHKTEKWFTVIIFVFLNQEPSSRLYSNVSYQAVGGDDQLFS